ncbi:MAG: CehA/McbA family metallohydrolase [Myxococcales bacterium]|nr:CehA/McbA family metallohydrolase [Polyangiaceae bacterium]MDW8249829.1 CehA/McbA family metallohydrolase [Myxococcales bacterium]
MSPHVRYIPWALVALLVVLNCADEAAQRSQEPVQPGAPSCLPLCFEPGSKDGHSDPLGAKMARQARAGRIQHEAQIVVGEDAKQRPRVGDFLLINDKIAVYIEDKRLSDGYAPFGGEILAVDRVGEDGRPAGVSKFGETLLAISKEIIDPESVTVLRDGSDGKEAVVRVMGRLKPIPFLGNLGALFPRTYGFLAIHDYILEPGSERLKVRLGLRNDGEEDADLKFDEMHGFFHSSKGRLFTPEAGYGEPKGHVSWAGFDGGEWSFAWRLPGRKMEYAISISGFQYFLGGGKAVPAGKEVFFDYVELIAGGPQLDGLLEAIRRVDGETPWSELKGTVFEEDGGPVAEAYVYLVAEDGRLLSRTVTDAQGNYTIHVPPGVPAKLIPSKIGYPKQAGVAAGGSGVLKLPRTATVQVKATRDTDGAALPVRIQVIPQVDLGGDPPAAWGEERPADGRSHVVFAMDGQATLAVAPGAHRILVSRGYEWEMVDHTVDVEAGQVITIEAKLNHSVDTTGVMCADFHIHSFHSADSSDPIEYKVKGALADGLDIPVSSEHEWVVDFQPVIQKLGLTQWAFGAPSEELTTFTWGHFGVLPLRPRADRVNMGAINWIGKEPPAFFDEVHAGEDRPILIVNHPSGGGFAAYFSTAGLNRATGKGKPGLWSDHFEAIEVYNDSDHDENRTRSVADWFALLNTGRKVWAVGSSDSHKLRTSPVGYPRSCIFFGHDDPEKLSPEILRDGVASGNLVVSGGLTMTVRGPEQQAPGQTIWAGNDEVTFTIEVQSPSWIKAKELEVIVNGETLLTEALKPQESTSPGKRYRNEVKVKRDLGKAHNWVVFHARGEGDLSPLHPGRRPFAVSNPIFLQ